MPATIINDPVTCDECRDHVVDTIRVEDRLLCVDCAQDCPECDGCGNRVESTTEAVDGVDICASCQQWEYLTCGCCDRPAPTRTITANGRSICEPCEDNCYWRCDGCDELIPLGIGCCDCEPEEDSSDYIHYYDYRPRPQFHGTGPLYLGFELEINTPELMRRECAETAIDHLGSLGYLKEDSTINDHTGYGFELVTHPMSYDWALTHFPWALLTVLRDADCTGIGNGLHVHVSRAAFSSPAHIYRWMKLFYRNTDDVIALARRYSTRWADFTTEARREVKNYAKGASGARYQAINTVNRDTFELRIFASSLDRQEVQAALALAAASVDYTRTLSIADITTRDGWDWASFARWVAQEPRYAPLSREMERLSCAC